HQVGLGARHVETARDAHDRVEPAVQVGTYAAAPEPGAADRAALIEVIATHDVAAAPVSARKGELQVARGGRAENGALPVDARAVQPGDAVGRDAPRPPAVRRLLTRVEVGGVHVGRVVAGVQDGDLAYHARHSGRGVERDLPRLAALAPLGGDDHHAVGAAASVDRRGGGVLQDVDRLDVGRGERGER